MSADAWSFEAEILRHLDSVYRVALWLSGDPTEAHDLTQATYEHALRARPRFVPENPRGWLLTILRHVFLNVRRHQAIVVEVPLEDHEAAMATRLRTCLRGSCGRTSRPRSTSCPTSCGCRC